jgi:MFS family permease
MMGQSQNPVKEKVMSDTTNPWRSPETEVSAAQDGSGAGVLTGTMVRYLREASPWLRFIGVLGFIGCGLMALGGLVFTVLVVLISDLAGEFGGILAGVFIGVLYLVLGLLSFFPAKFSYAFGSKIHHYILSNSDKDLEEALKNNKSLWKFFGILAIVYLSIIPLALIGGAVVAVISALG